MALIREIIDYVLSSDRDLIFPKWDNFRQVFRDPTVTDGDHLTFVPGYFDASMARLSVTIKGSTFVRGRDDPMWRPKEDVDLVGCRSFVSSQRLRDLGYDEFASDGNGCRDLALRVLSDALNKDCWVDRLFEKQYRDFRFWRYDFEAIIKKLKTFRYSGYVYDKDGWKGTRELQGKDMVTEKVCALGLLESLDSKQALNHVYVDIPRSDCELLVDVSRGIEEGYRYLMSIVRRIDAKSKVRLLLSRDKMNSLHVLLENSTHEARRDVLSNLKEMFDKAIRKWKRECGRDIAWKLVCASTEEVKKQLGLLSGEDLGRIFTEG